MDPRWVGSAKRTAVHAMAMGKPRITKAAGNAGMYPPPPLRDFLHEKRVPDDCEPAVWFYQIDPETDWDRSGLAYDKARKKYARMLPDVQKREAEREAERDRSKRDRSDEALDQYRRRGDKKARRASMFQEVFSQILRAAGIAMGPLSALGDLVVKKVEKKSLILESHRKGGQIEEIDYVLALEIMCVDHTELMKSHLQCSAGHTLAQHAALHGRKCDSCNVNCVRALMHRCRECEWAICLPCSAAQIQELGVQSPGARVDGLTARADSLPACPPASTNVPVHARMCTHACSTDDRGCTRNRTSMRGLAV